jgi:acetolactate synthase-1/2/3 large subunit
VYWDELPGTTNLVTPIADAWMDSTPMLAICGQVSSAVLGKDAFQETDITGITMPITKHNYLIKRVEDIAYAIKEAIFIATTGRRSVLVDIAKDALQASMVPDYSKKIFLPGYRPTYQGSKKQVEPALDLMLKSKKPIMMIWQWRDELRMPVMRLSAFAERYQIPVITTLHGLGAFPQDHPLSLGMPGCTAGYMRTVLSKK